MLLDSFISKASGRDFFRWEFFLTFYLLTRWHVFLLCQNAFTVRFLLIRCFYWIVEKILIGLILFYFYLLAEYRQRRCEFPHGSQYIYTNRSLLRTLDIRHILYLFLLLLTIVGCQDKKFIADEVGVIIIIFFLFAICDLCLFVYCNGKKYKIIKIRFADLHIIWMEILKLIK